MRLIVKISLLHFFLFLVFTPISSQSVTDSIVQYFNNNQRDSAILLVDKYMPIFESEEDWNQLVILQRYKSIIYAATKTEKEYLVESEKAVQLAKKYLPDTSDTYLMTVLKHGLTLSQSFKFEEALTLLTELSNKASKEEKLKEYEIRSNSEIAIIRFNQKLYDEAIKLAKKAEHDLQLRPELDSFHFIKIYRALGNCYEHKFQLDSTMIYKKKAHQIMLSAHPPNHPNVGISFNDMGGFYFEKGMFNKALEYFKICEGIFYQDYLKNGTGRYLAVPISNIGMVYDALGEYALAKEYYTKSRQLAIQDYNENHIGTYDALSKLITSSLKLNQIDEARKYYSIAKNILDNWESPEDESKSHLQSTYITLILQEGKYKETIEKGENLFGFLEKKEGRYTKRCLSLTNNISKAYLHLNDYRNAIIWSDMQMGIADSMYADFNPELTIPYTNRLTIFNQFNKNELFDNLFLQLLGLKNNGDQKHQISSCIPESNLLDAFKIKSENLSKRIKSGEFGFKEYDLFLDDFIIYFNSHLSIVRSSNSLNTDYRHLRSIFLPSIQHHVNKEPKRAIVLVELLKSMSIKLNLQSQLVSDEKSVINLNHKIQDVISKLHESNDNALYIELGNSIDMLAANKDSLFKNNPTLYNQKFGFNNITIDDITKPIMPGELMLEYFVNDSVVYVFSISAQTMKCKTINIEALKNKLTKKVELDDNLRKELFNTLLPEDAKVHKKLLIIPDEFLFYLNFEEFITNKGSYLLQDYMIRYGYSASILNLQNEISKGKKVHKSNILSVTPGFAQSLKDSYLESASDQEIDSSWLTFLQQPFLINLASTLESVKTSKSLTDSQATEYGYKVNSSNYRIIHFGTHGILNDKSPLFSKLIFAKDKEEDGYLHTYEIYGQNLSADLAVLSACQTGKGEWSDGEGVISLAHGFTYAGCPSVVMSMWNIDEKSSAQILESFYKYLLKGKKKSEALHQAKVDFIAQSPPQLHDPYYWAGLVLIGDDSAMFSQSWYSTKWGIGIVVLGLAFLLFFVWKRLRK